MAEVKVISQKQEKARTQEMYPTAKAMHTPLGPRAPAAK